MERATPPGEYLLPARRWLALRVEPGTQLQVINSSGTQVVDTWAFHAEDSTEHMSMEHTRASILRLRPRVGQQFVTNHRRAILRLVDDHSPGIHDTLMPSCDRYRYEQLGAEGYHDNCTDNLASALASESHALVSTPSPLNLFMHVPVSGDLGLEFAAPRSEPGDYVVLEAVMPSLIVMSACPQDMIPVNGELMEPQDVAIVVGRRA